MSSQGNIIQEVEAAKNFAFSLVALLCIIIAFLRASQTGELNVKSLGGQTGVKLLASIVAFYVSITFIGDFAIADRRGILGDSDRTWMISVNFVVGVIMILVVSIEVLKNFRALIGGYSYGSYSYGGSGGMFSFGKKRKRRRS